MSSSRQKDLQQSGQNQAPADVATTEPPPEMSAIIERVAHRMFVYGSVSERTMKNLCEKYEFLSSSHPFHAFYQRKLADILADVNAAIDLDDDSPLYYPRKKSFTIPVGITSTQFGIMRLTGMFLARYGDHFMEDLRKAMGCHPLFEFLQPSSGHRNFLNGLFAAYTRVVDSATRRSDASAFNWFFHLIQFHKRDEDERDFIDMHAFLIGADSFTHMVDVDYFEITSQPPHFSRMMKQMLPQRRNSQTQNQHGGAQQPDPRATHVGSFTLPAGITHKDLGIIKLTALFVARYGERFLRNFMESCVARKPLFDFMQPTDSRKRFFDGLVSAYSRVSRCVCHDEACTAPILDSFFDRLQFEKLEEEGEETAAAVIDLHAFVSWADCFARMEDDDYLVIMPQPKFLSTVMNLPTTQSQTQH